MSHLEKNPLSVMYVLGSVSKASVAYEQGTHPIIFSLHPSVKHFDMGVRFFQLYKESYPRRFFKNIKWRRVYLQRLQKIVNEIQPDVSFECSYVAGDIIEDCYYDLLVKNYNVSDLAEKILWMCTNPPKRQIMGVAA